MQFKPSSDENKESREFDNLSQKISTFIFSKKLFFYLIIFLSLINVIGTILSAIYSYSSSMFYLFLLPTTLLAFYNVKIAIMYSVGVNLWSIALKFLAQEVYLFSATLLMRDLIFPSFYFILISILIGISAHPRTKEINYLKDENEYLQNRKENQDRELMYYKTQIATIENVLSESEMRRESLLMQFNGALIRLNRDQYITFANNKFLQFIGKPEREVIGRNINIFPEFYKLVQEQDVHYMNTPKLVGKSKNYIWNVSKIAPNPTQNNYFYLIIGVETSRE